MICTNTSVYSSHKSNPSLKNKENIRGSYNFNPESMVGGGSPQSLKKFH